jgi:hypothetical protein
MEPFDTAEGMDPEPVDELVADGPAGETPPAPRRRLGWLAKTGIALVTVVALLALTALVLYNFGTMESPSPEMRVQYQQLVAAGLTQKAPDPGFHVPIPGCKCHSTDPVLTMQHEGLRIRDCSQCHDRVGPQAAR